MPSKDELVQRYNRMNTIPQVLVGLAPVRQDPSPGMSLGFRDGWGNSTGGGGYFKDHLKESGMFLDEHTSRVIYGLSHKYGSRD